MGMIFIMWYVGGACALPLGSNFPPGSKELLATVRYPNLTKICSVPLFFQRLIPLLRQENKDGFQALSRLKFVLSTGAPCSPDICRELTEHGVNLIIAYGSTETGFILVSGYDMTTEHQWQSLRKLKGRQASLKFLPLDSDNRINELVVVSTDPFLAPELRARELYSTGDLFLEKSSGTGVYIIQGRRDDVLVHTTGEKTNPLPIELAIQQHRIIEHVIIFGDRHPYCSALVELNKEEASNHEYAEVEQQVLAAVQDANKDAPAHSHIVPALIKILPLGKHLAITNKGNLIRKQINVQYGPMIEQMYAQFLDQPITNRDSEQRHWTKGNMVSYLQETVARILNKPVERFDDHSKSLFALSLDSLTTVQLLNTLYQTFGTLDQNIIFEFPTIDALADQLLAIVNEKEAQPSDDPQHYQETEKIIDQYIDFMKARPKNTLTMSKNSGNDEKDYGRNKQIVLITGANGSLGSEILLQLVSKPQVSRIYCLVRGENAAHRLRDDMASRKQDTTILLDTARIIILSMNLNDEKLGQSTTMYEQLRRDVTDIIHSAWKMDFNLTISDFDRECLQGHYQLLQFASSSLSQSPMRFHFISSIASAGSGLIGKVNEAPLPRQKGISLAHGYGQSKYAGEHICSAAMDHWGISVDIYRVGQISGHSATGVWNISEMIPLLVCAGGGEMNMLPEDGPRIDWIPVDYCAACITDIVTNLTSKAVFASERVHHILNPRVITWKQFLDYLKSLGLQFNVVSTEQWLSQLLVSPRNPAYTLAGFFHKIFGDGKTFEIAEYSLERTLKRTPVLQECPPIDRKLIMCYLKYWSEIGFFKSNYIPTN